MKIFFSAIVILLFSVTASQAAYTVHGELSTEGVTPAETTAAAAKTGDAQITVNWTAVAGAEGYRIYRNGSPIALTTLGSGVTSYADSGLAPNTYTYKVQPFTGALAPALADITPTAGITVTAPVTPPSSGGGGGGGGGSPTPTIVSSSNAPLTVGSAQTGTMQYTFTGGSGASVAIPAGAVSSNTTFNASVGSLTAVQTPATTTGAFMVGGAVFNITAVDASGGAVRDFKSNLTVTLHIPNLPDDEDDLAVYYFNDAAGQWVVVPGAVFNSDTGQVTFSVSHLTIFAIFTAPEMPNTIAVVGASSAAAESETDEEDAGKINGQVLGLTIDARAQQVQQIDSEGVIVNSGIVADLLALLERTRDTKLEEQTTAAYTVKLTAKVNGLSATSTKALTTFIAYGTPTTLKLGAGERAGAVNSYKTAFGKLPTTVDEWTDVLKIANGRWPSARSADAEKRVVSIFGKIYWRLPDRAKNSHDDAAITIMAYGLRPDARNLDSEKTAIKSFKTIFGYAPTTAANWDAVRAIAYSGAQR